MAAERLSTAFLEEYGCIWIFSRCPFQDQQDAQYERGQISHTCYRISSILLSKYLGVGIYAVIVVNCEFEKTTPRPSGARIRISAFGALVRPLGKLGSIFQSIINNLACFYRHGSRVWKGSCSLIQLSYNNFTNSKAIRYFPASWEFHLLVPVVIVWVLDRYHPENTLSVFRP